MIADAHNDVVSCLSSLDFIKDYLAQCRRQGAKLINLALWSTRLEGNAHDILQRILPFYDYNEIQLAFSVEDLGFLQLGDAHLLQGIDHASLTWNYDNRYGGGALEHGGLTQQGVEMVRILQSMGVALDTAHLNRRTFFEVIEICDKIMCSHACFDAVRSHPRNLNDQQIDEIVARNGFVGVTLVPDFLCYGNATALDVARHIDHFVQRHGDAYLGIGSDFFGSAQYPNDLFDYKSFFSLQQELIGLGYSQQSIEKIFSRNYLTFLSECRQLRATKV